MGSRRMSSLKMTLPILALSLLLSITTQVLGKPSPKHLLIETEEQAKKTSGSNEDYQSWWPNYQTRIGRDDIGSHNQNSGQFNGNQNTRINNSGNQVRNGNCIKWCFGERH